ncbi:MAG: hypothetical protein Q7W45_00210 [Bacteroidota bacterium]|nr:hypothetical protein [Bacteroidota bacterium]MDP3146139.1 hypothetical protein [Bacteroidota bacterium]MDP3556708.1 hypothetical protein [Bacteroidota bacterium]
MKKIIACFVFLTIATNTFSQETVKSKALKLKYTPPEGWIAEEFGDKLDWEISGNVLCKCSGAKFSKQHKDGKMNVVIYPSSQSGLDSAKRNFVGVLRFENVEKYDKTKNKFFSFERKKSNFTDSKLNKKSFDVIRYFAKVEDHFYIIYAWQENLNLMSPQTEKELFQMVNAIEPF